MMWLRLTILQRGWKYRLVCGYSTVGPDVWIDRVDHPRAMLEGRSDGPNFFRISFAPAKCRCNVRGEGVIDLQFQEFMHLYNALWFSPQFFFLFFISSDQRSVLRIYHSYRRIFLFFTHFFRFYSNSRFNS